MKVEPVPKCEMASNPRVLLIEGDKTTALALLRSMEQAGLTAVWAGDQPPSSGPGRMLVQHRSGRRR